MHVSMNGKFRRVFPRRPKVFTFKASTTNVSQAPPSLLRIITREAPLYELRPSNDGIEIALLGAILYEKGIFTVTREMPFASRDHGIGSIRGRTVGYFLYP